MLKEIKFCLPIFISTALAMEDRIGNFEVGKEFDALVINLEAPGSEVDVFDEDTLEDCIQKFIYLGKPNRTFVLFI